MKKTFFYLFIWYLLFQVETFFLLSFHNSFFVPRFSWVFLVYAFLSLNVWESFLIAVCANFVFNSLGTATPKYFILIYSIWALLQLFKKHSSIENPIFVSAIALAFYYSFDFFLSLFFKEYSPYPVSFSFILFLFFKIGLQVIFCGFFLWIFKPYLSKILLWEFFHTHKFKKINLFAARSLKNFGKRRHS